MELICSEMPPFFLPEFRACAILINCTQSTQWGFDVCIPVTTFGIEVFSLSGIWEYKFQQKYDQCGKNSACYYSHRVN